MCVLSDCVVRIETRLWIIRLHLCEKAYVRNVVKCLTTVDHTTTVHSAWAWPAVGTGRWALAVHSSQCID